MPEEIEKKEIEKKELLKYRESLVLEVMEYDRLKMIPDVKERLSESNDRLKSLILNIHEGLRLDDLKKKKKVLENKIYNVKDILSSNRKVINKAKDIESIRNIDMNALFEVRDELVEKLKIDNPFNIAPIQIFGLVDNFTTFITRLTNHFRELDKYESDGICNSDSIDELQQSINRVDAMLEYELRKRSGIEAELKHLKTEHTDDTIDCPKCKTVISIKDNTSTIAKLENSLLQNERENKLKKEKIRLNEKMIRTNTKFRLYDELTVLLSDKQLQPFIFHAYTLTEFDLISNYNPLINAMKTVLVKMNSFVDVEMNTRELDKINVEIEINENNISRMSSLDINIESIGTLNERESRYTLELTSLETELRVLREDIKRLNLIVDEVRLNRTFQNAHVHNHTVALNNIKRKYVDKLLEVVDEKVSEIDTLLMNNNRKVIERDMQNKNISDLKNELSMLETLVSSLSPTTGIISDALRSFMDGFLETINETLSSVWSYGMVVNPCEVNKRGQLDYKFPVTIDGVNRLNDIKEGSLAMREIFDLTFRLSSIKMLGLESYPLFLDEFSNNMDDVHKDNVFNKLETLGKGRQLFLISHFADFYSGLKGSEINVLSKANIRMDSIDVYNKSMIITRG
jgi:hypothetical protein